MYQEPQVPFHGALILWPLTVGKSDIIEGSSGVWVGCSASGLWLFETGFLKLAMALVRIPRRCRVIGSHLLPF